MSSPTRSPGSAISTVASRSPSSVSSHSSRSPRTAGAGAGSYAVEPYGDSEVPSSNSSRQGPPAWRSSVSASEWSSAGEPTGGGVSIGATPGGMSAHRGTSGSRGGAGSSVRRGVAGRGALRSGTSTVRSGSRGAVGGRNATSGSGDAGGLGHSTSGRSAIGGTTTSSSTSGNHVPGTGLRTGPPSGVFYLRALSSRRL